MDTCTFPVKLAYGLPDQQTPQILVIDSHRELIYRLTGDHRTIWNAIDGKRSIAHIIQKTGLPLVQVKTALFDLETKGLVQRQIRAEVLLVAAPPAQGLVDNQHPGWPLGILYLAAALEKAGLLVAVLDPTSFEDAVVGLRTSQYQILGISSVTSTFPNAASLAQFSYSQRPAIPIVLGGMHVSARPEQSIEETRVPVTVVTGEAELVAPTIFRNLLEKGIGQSQIVSGQPVDELDSIPWPARHLIDPDNYQGCSILSSRGCIGNCYFCACRGFRTYRSRKVAAVLEEVRYLKEEMGMLDLIFEDDMFPFPPDRVRKICRGIQAIGGIQFGIQARGDMDLSLLPLLAEAGCQIIHFGVETGSPDIFARIGKGRVTLQQYLIAIKTALDCGIKVATSFIIGHPGETLATIEDTRRLALDLVEHGVTVAISTMTPLPRTPLGDSPEKFGLIPRYQRGKENWTERDVDCKGLPDFDLPELSTEQIAEEAHKLVLECADVRKGGDEDGD